MVRWKSHFRATLRGTPHLRCSYDSFPEKPLSRGRSTDPPHPTLPCPPPHQGPGKPRQKPARTGPTVTWAHGHLQVPELPPDACPSKPLSILPRAPRGHARSSPGPRWSRRLILSFATFSVPGLSWVLCIPCSNAPTYAGLVLTPFCRGGN